MSFYSHTVLLCFADSEEEAEETDSGAAKRSVEAVATPKVE